MNRLKTCSGKIVFAAHDDRRGVHDIEAVGQHLVERQARIALGIGIGDRIGVVDSVDLGRLEQDFRIDFDGAQARRRVGREERIAGAGAEDHHAALLEMANRAAPDVILANLIDAQAPT